MGLFNRFNKRMKKTLIIQCSGLGDLNFKEVKTNTTEELFICQNNQAVMAKYKPVIRLYGLSDNNIRIYTEAFEYINSNKEIIQKNLKAFYLRSHEPEDIEKRFRITDISGLTYQIIVDYKSEAEENGYNLIVAHDLQAFINNSKEDDLFLEIASDFVLNKYQCSDEFAIAYINLRTKEICYCYDVF